MELFEAATRGILEEVRSVVERSGASILEDGNGSEAILLASRYGHTEVLRFLLDQGCSIEFSTENGYHPLHFAAEHGHLEVVKLLLERDCDVNVRVNMNAVRCKQISAEQAAERERMCIAATSLFSASRAA